MGNSLFVELLFGAKIFAYAFLFGAAAALVFDAFRIIRTSFGCGVKIRGGERSLPIIGAVKRKKRTAAGKTVSVAIIGVFDFAYMILFAASSVVFVYHFLYGIVRWYAVFGTAFGFALYMSTIGRLTAAAAGEIIFLAGSALRYIVYFTLYPIKAAASLVGVFLKKILTRASSKISRSRSERRLSRYERRTLKIRSERLLSAVFSGNGDKKDV